MSLSSSDYALLAQDSYHDPVLNKRKDIGGIEYEAIDTANNRLTGFQATAYRRADTGEVIIAYRGTEFDREPIQDGGVDAGMVLSGVNIQRADSEAFTERVLEKARLDADLNHTPMQVTVTGHSLGGTLAEINAAKFGLKGETFNAYGAGSLFGTPKGGDSVVDHVRAGDLVSAASPHFGEVRVYAAQQDIDTLSRAGYRDDSGLLSPRDPIKATHFDAHAIDNFVPNSKLLGESIISPENQARYRAHEGMVDRYRNDVMDIRMGLSASWEVPKAVGETVAEAGHYVAEAAHDVKVGMEHVGHDIAEGASAVGHAVREAAHHVAETASHVRDEVSKDLHAAGDVIGRGASGAWNTVTHPGSWFGHDAAAAPKLDDPAHPDHAMFRQALKGVHQVDAQHGRTPDRQSSNVAGALTTAARTEGMDRIDHVMMNADASRTYAIQGGLDSPLKRVAEVSTTQAVTTSIETSSQQWQQTVATQQSAEAQQTRDASQVTPSAPAI